MNQSLEEIFLSQDEKKDQKIRQEMRSLREDEENKTIQIVVAITRSLE